MKKVRVLNADSINQFSLKKVEDDQIIEVLEIEDVLKFKNLGEMLTEHYTLMSRLPIVIGFMKSSERPSFISIYTCEADVIE